MAHLAIAVDALLNCLPAILKPKCRKAFATLRVAACHFVDLKSPIPEAPPGRDARTG